MDQEVCSKNTNYFTVFLNLLITQKLLIFCYENGGINLKLISHRIQLYQKINDVTLHQNHHGNNMQNGYQIKAYS